MKREEYKKRNNYKRHHAPLAEDEDEEEEEGGHQRKQARDKDAEEYVLLSAFSGSVTPREDIWLIDSGASKHMTGQKKLYPNLKRIALLRKYP